MKRKPLKFLAILLCGLLIFQQTGFAQVASVELNIAGRFASFQNNFSPDKFRPLHLRSISYDGLNNNFKLILDKGDTQDLKTQEIESTTKDLLNYFYVGIALPNDTFWVNLRPDSPNDIIDPLLAQTEVGKIFLEADLQLKKDTANATNPGTPEGREYWHKLYQKAGEIYGNQNVTIPTLTRPWVVPDEIIVRESMDSAYVYKATLKVMLEQDYLKGNATYSFKDEKERQLNEYSSQIMREEIIPKLTKEINNARRYAPLRQVYYSLILAQWFKARNQNKNTEYSERIDRKDLTNLVAKIPYSVGTYFNIYKENFAKGEYNIKEPISTPYGQVIRSYFSGGMNLSSRGTSYAEGLGAGVGEGVGVGVGAGGKKDIALIPDAQVGQVGLESEHDLRVENVTAASQAADRIGSPQPVRPAAPFSNQQIDDSVDGYIGGRSRQERIEGRIEPERANVLSHATTVDAVVESIQSGSLMSAFSLLTSDNPHMERMQGGKSRYVAAVTKDRVKRDAKLTQDVLQNAASILNAMPWLSIEEKASYTQQMRALTDITSLEKLLSKLVDLGWERKQFFPTRIRVAVHERGSEWLFIANLLPRDIRVEIAKAAGVETYVSMTLGHTLEIYTENRNNPSVQAGVLLPVSRTTASQRYSGGGTADFQVFPVRWWQSAVQGIQEQPSRLFSNEYYQGGATEVDIQTDATSGTQIPAEQLIYILPQSQRATIVQRLGGTLPRNIVWFDDTKFISIDEYLGWLTSTPEGQQVYNQTINMRVDSPRRNAEVVPGTDPAPSISSTGFGNERQANLNILEGILKILNIDPAVRQRRLAAFDANPKSDLAEDLNLPVDNPNVYMINGQRVVVIAAPYLSVTEEGEQYASAGLRRGVVYITRAKFEEWQQQSILEQQIKHEQDEVSYLRRKAREMFPGLDEATAYELFSAFLKNPANQQQARDLISGAHQYAESQGHKAVDAGLSTAKQPEARVLAITAPPIPEGWTYLSHGTNLSRRQWDSGYSFLFEQDIFVVNRNHLSVVTREDLEDDRRRGDTGTTTGYSHGFKRPDMSDEEFKIRNKPVYIRIIFPMNYLNFSGLKKQFLPRVPEDRRDVLMALIGKYYLYNIQHGRHPLVPSGTRLIKLAHVVENGIDVLYYIPEEVKDLYESMNSGVDPSMDKVSSLNESSTAAGNPAGDLITSAGGGVASMTPAEQEAALAWFYHGQEAGGMPNDVRRKAAAAFEKLPDGTPTQVRRGIRFNREEERQIYLRQLESEGYTPKEGAESFSEDGRTAEGASTSEAPVIIIWSGRTKPLRGVKNQLLQALGIGGINIDGSAEVEHIVTRSGVVEKIISREDGRIEVYVSEGRLQNNHEITFQNQPGGIDFRFLPIVTQSMDNLKASIRTISASGLQRIDLTQEWSDIKSLVNSGITPSAERLKEYLVASSFKGSLDGDMGKIVSCISDILRMQEETCCATDPILKDILVVLGSGRSGQELKLAFAI